MSVSGKTGDGSSVDELEGMPDEQLLALLEQGDARQRVLAAWCLALRRGKHSRDQLRVQLDRAPDVGTRRHLLIVLAGLLGRAAQSSGSGAIWAIHTPVRARSGRVALWRGSIGVSQPGVGEGAWRLTLAPPKEAMSHQDSLVVACSACGQKNRVPVTKAGARGHCGRCKATLPAPSQPIEVERADELRAVLQTAKVPVLVDFWASWCGPCRMVAPEVAKVAQRHGGEWLVVKANTEVDPQLGAEHGVRSIPMMAVFEGGRELARTAGARPAGAIEGFVREALAGR